MPVCKLCGFGTCENHACLRNNEEGSVARLAGEMALNMLKPERAYSSAGPIDSPVDALTRMLIRVSGSAYASHVYVLQSDIVAVAQWMMESSDGGY